MWISEDSAAVGRHADLWSVLPPEAMGTFTSMLLLEAMSGFMIVWQLESVLMFQTCVTTKRTYRYPWSGLQSEAMC